MKRCSMGIPDLSCSIANYFGKELELDEGKTDILRYGFEVIIGEGIKVISIFVMASLLGLTPYVLVAFLTVGTYRLFSGGYHSETYSRCFIFSVFLFLGMGKITQLLLPYFKLPVAQIITLICVVFVWSLWIAIKWAPAETPNKPLAEGEKTRQKKFSVIWVLLWFLVTSFLALAFPLEKTGIIVLGTLLAHTLQSFSVTPLGFRAMRSLDTPRIK
ncbi:accessory protein regulator protein B [Desulfitobacterium hafniense DP7]|uniref:Accessory protein regulator protein B n=2 Tax=Desulfitobacterium hafniense TaxID=49338 RepID=G9XKN4_DESHA|nr:accessory protein regulator protein B [Desulfitobacterium hafniense DP7]